MAPGLPTTRPGRGRGGRPRDRARSEAILEAAIELLPEVGCDALTMELVAARAGAGKATLYRRWSSKDELVLDVVDRIRHDADRATLPDTQSLRGDLSALFRSSAVGDRTPAVRAGLATMLSRHAGLAAAGAAAVVEPWTVAHRTLIRRAAERGEIPDADSALVDTVASVVPALVAFRVLLAHRPVDLDDLLALIDHVVIPALHPRSADGACTDPAARHTRPLPTDRPGAIRHPGNGDTMSVAATLHLNFAGQARQALEFYRSVFGGELMVATYADFGAPADSPDAAAVVWGQVAADNGFRVMAYDVPTAGRSGTPATAATTRREYGTTITSEPFFVSLRGDDADEITAQWQALSEGATVVEPLAPAQWAPLFGMLTDRFGITWVVDVSAPYAG